jgi:hypothetical protein
MFNQSHILFAIIFLLAKPKYQGMVSDSGMQAQGLVVQLLKKTLAGLPVLFLSVKPSKFKP